MVGQTCGFSHSRLLLLGVPLLVATGCPVLLEDDFTAAPESPGGDGPKGAAASPAPGGSLGAGSGGAGGRGGVGGSSTAAGSSASEGGSPSGGATAGGGAITQNLIEDPSFESGVAVGWEAWGNVLFTRVSDSPAEGSYCLRVFQREATWVGAAYELAAEVVSGAQYETSLWVRTSKEGQPINLTLKVLCEGASASDFEILQSDTLGTDWTQLAGSFRAPDCALVDLLLYVEGPPVGVDIYLDNVAVRFLETQ